MAKAMQLSVVLTNKPGRLAELCGLLADAKVNIIALAVLENADMGVVRLVADKPKDAAKTLKENGVPLEAEVRPFAGTRVIFFDDPEGNRCQIVWREKPV